MELKQYLDETPRGVQELRQAIGVRSDEQIRQWARVWNGRRPSPAYCVRIEAATGKAVSRKDLRPNDWRDIWPELAEE